MNTQKKRS